MWEQEAHKEGWKVSFEGYRLRQVSVSDLKERDGEEEGEEDGSWWNNFTINRKTRRDFKVTGCVLLETGFCIKAAHVVFMVNKYNMYSSLCDNFELVSFQSSLITLNEDHIKHL